MESTCNQRRLCDRESCELCFQRSFANSDKAQFWDVDLNKGVVPRQAFLSSHKKFWFRCSKCQHNFTSVLYILSSGVWCPFCVNQKLCSNENCKHCFEKSFASHGKARFWNFDKNDRINPREVFLSSGKKYWFTCSKCQHNFKTVLSRISSGVWCPYCSSHKLCNNQKCKQCFEKSFAYSSMLEL